MKRHARWTASALLALLLCGVTLLAGLRLAASWHEETGAVPPAGGRLISVPGAEIYVQLHGPETGTPVLLVHGTAAWSGFWAGVAADLGRNGCRAIAVDLPPFGFSSRSAEGAYTRRDQAARLKGLIEALGLPRAIIVGHSFGAGPAVETAMRHPEKVSGLILVDGALGLPEGAAYPPDNALLRAALSQPFLAETFVSATMTNSGLTHYLLAGLLHRKDAASGRQIDILRIPLRASGDNTGLCPLAARTHFSGPRRPQRRA